MIRINLAKKKQASYSGLAASKAGALKSFDSSSLISLLSKMTVPAALCFCSYVAFHYYSERKIQEFQNEMASVDKDKLKIQNELKKIRGSETQTAELEKVSQSINNKITAIEKLVLGRDRMVKSMISLSQSLPKDVWTTEITATESNYDIHCNTTDIGLVSDVMSKLGASTYFKEVSLKGSSTDATGHQASFELTARRE